MIGADDRFVSLGNLPGNRLSNGIDLAQKVHHQRSAVKDLVDVQKHLLAAGVAETIAACLVRLAIVTLQSLDQLLVRLRRRADDSISHGVVAVPIFLPVMPRNHLGDFDATWGSDNNTASAIDGNQGVCHANFPQSADSNEVVIQLDSPSFPEDFSSRLADQPFADKYGD